MKTIKMQQESINSILDQEKEIFEVQTGGFNLPSERKMEKKRMKKQKVFMSDINKKNMHYWIPRKIREGEKRRMLRYNS